MQRILVGAGEWCAEAKLVQSRMELDELQWSSGVQRRAWRGWSALWVCQRSARECIHTFRQHPERRHVERVLGLWCSWSAPRAQRRVATPTFQRRAAVRSSRDARVEAGESCLLRASGALWYAVVAEFQRLRKAAKRMRLRAASVRRRGARATARRRRRVVLRGFEVRAARPAANRMRLRTASVRRRGRERRHVVVDASSSTVSGCELPGKVFWLRLWETIRHALSFFRYQQPRVQFGALVPHEVPVQCGAPVPHGARFASTCSVLRVLSCFCASSVFAAPAPGVEYTSLVPAASFVAPATAWTQYRRVWLLLDSVPAAVEGGAHRAIASCGFCSSAFAVRVAPAPVVEFVSPSSAVSDPVGASGEALQGHFEESGASATARHQHDRQSVCNGCPPRVGLVRPARKLWSLTRMVRWSTGMVAGSYVTSIRSNGGVAQAVPAHAPVATAATSLVVEYIAQAPAATKRRCLAFAVCVAQASVVMPAATGSWRGQVALSGWHFVALRPEAYSAGDKEVTMGSLCKKYRLKVVQQLLVLESGTLIRDWTLRTTKLARVQDPMQAKERAPLRAALAAKRMRLRTASVRRRGARATARRSRRVVLHGFGVREGSSGNQMGAAEDCLSAQEGGRERWHVVIAASFPPPTVSGCELPGG